MVVSSKGRIMTLIIILFVILTGPAYAQCKIEFTVDQTDAIHGINNGIDRYYQNLIIQDVAIAGQQKFQDISLGFDFIINYSVDHCRPGQIDISVMPVQFNCQPLLYRGFDFSASLRPENADLVFHIIHENGLVTDSLTFYKIMVDENSKLYHTQSFQNNSFPAVRIAFARADFHYTKSSYEKFRDHVLKIDDYFAADMIADSAILWAQHGFLSEKDNMAEMALRKTELERILKEIRPDRFDSVFLYGQYDLNGLNAKYKSLSALSMRYKAIIGYNRNTSAGYAFLKNQLLKSYLDHFDYYYQLSFNTDFRYVNFLNELARPDYSNADLLGLYRDMTSYTGSGGKAVRQCSRMLAEGLLDRGIEFEIKGNQLRARTYYISARELSKLLHLKDYQNKATQMAGKMNEAIASSYIEISRKGALRENPAIAVQYFRDACGMYSDPVLAADLPAWVLEYEKWLFLDFEKQVVKNIEQKNYKKALDYLTEIQDYSLSSSTYTLPPLFHDWMKRVREGIYLILLDRARVLMETDEQYESEQVYRKAVDMRQKAGYRIDKNVLEAKLEVMFFQMYYDDFYDEGSRNYEKGEFVSALYYFNKAEYIEKSGVSRPNARLMEKRQGAARQVIFNLLSEGRLKAWAHDFDAAETILNQVDGMLTDYQFTVGDTLTRLYTDLEESVLRTECEIVFSNYNTLMEKAKEAESGGNFIMAHQYANDAASYSMDNLKCGIRDEEAWYLKIKLESLADYQEMEHELDLMAYKSVPDYLDFYQELKKYYNRHKLLDQGVVFTSLYDRVMQQKDSAFLTGMLSHYIFLRDYNHALQLLERIHALQFKSESVKNLQRSLAEQLARRDAKKAGEEDPWDILSSYAGKDKWYKTFRWTYKKTWLKETNWNIKFWPIIWKK